MNSHFALFSVHILRGLHPEQPSEGVGGWDPHCTAEQITVPETETEPRCAGKTGLSAQKDGWRTGAREGGTLVWAGEAPLASLLPRGTPLLLSIATSGSPPVLHMGGEVGGGWHRAQSHSCLEPGRRAPKFSPPPHPTPPRGDPNREIEGRQPQCERQGGKEERKLQAGDP